jgi:hypothetical protein
LKTKESDILAREINKQVITNVTIGDKVFVELRQYGCTWYESLGLDRFEYLKYVIPFEYKEWKNQAHRKILIESELTGDSWFVSNLWIRQFGSRKVFDETSMVLIDEQFLVQHPEVLGETNRERVINRCKTNLGL